MDGRGVTHTDWKRRVVRAGLAGLLVLGWSFTTVVAEEYEEKCPPIRICYEDDDERYDRAIRVQADWPEQWRCDYRNVISTPCPPETNECAPACGDCTCGDCVLSGVSRTDINIMIDECRAKEPEPSPIDCQVLKEFCYQRLWDQAALDCWENQHKKSCSFACTTNGKFHCGKQKRRKPSKAACMAGWPK